MKGLEEARACYERYGRPMIHEQFPEYEGRIAVGLAGRGSECLGFDDELSRDHDFAPGFCLWLTEEDEARIGLSLRRAYRALGLGKAAQRNAMAEESRGVHSIERFYRRYTGSSGAPESWEQWLSLPSYALAEATSGEVWRDDLGRFTAIREALLHGMPEDVRLKHLSARLLEMAQSGQYNYGRCLAHGEAGAAMLALSDFVRAAAQSVYLLNRRHAPYYKWLLRGMEALPRLSDLRPALDFLLTAENDRDTQSVKQGVVEDLCQAVARELRVQGLSNGDWDFLEPHAYAVRAKIVNPRLRAMHPMED